MQLRIYILAIIIVFAHVAANCETYHTVIPTEPFSAPGIDTSDVSGALAYASLKDTATIVLVGTVGGYSQATIMLSIGNFDDLYKYCVEHDSPLCRSTYRSIDPTETQQHLMDALLRNWILVYRGNCPLIVFPNSNKKVCFFGGTYPIHWLNLEMTKFDSAESLDYKKRSGQLYSHPVIGAFSVAINHRNSTPEYVPYTSSEYYTTITGDVFYEPWMRDAMVYGTRPTSVDIDGTEYGLMPYTKTCRDDAVLYCCLNNLYLTSVHSNQKFPGWPSYVYREQFDWYELQNSSGYEYVKFTTTKLDDPYDIGSVYVFTDKDKAKSCTNFTIMAANAESVCSLKNAKSGFNFATKGKDGVLLCVAHPDFDWAQKGSYPWYTNVYGRVVYRNGFPTDVVYEETDSPQKYCRVTKYRFKLTAGQKDPEPVQVEGEPIQCAPLIYTNTYRMTISDCLVREGMDVTAAVTPVTATAEDVTFHLVDGNNVSHGTMTVKKGSLAEQTCEYTAPFKSGFTPDYDDTLHIKNYSVDARAGITIRDLFVEYSATEKRYYDDDGTVLFPETGYWFVDRDHVMRCVNDDSDDASITVNAKRSGTLVLACDREFTADGYDTTSRTSVVQTNFIESASGFNHTRIIESVAKDRPSGSYSYSKKIKTASLPISSGKAIRITAPTDSKFTTFRME